MEVNDHIEDNLSNFASEIEKELSESELDKLNEFPSINKESRMKGSSQNECTKKFECSKCMKLFSSKKALKLHMSSLHEDLGISCLLCKKSFQNLISYKNHENKCDFGVSCLFCKNSFDTLSKLKIHQKKRGIDLVLCTKCGKGPKDFTTLKSYHDHLQTHIKELVPVECPICFKTFSRKQVLKVHTQTIHNGENFKCTQCDKVFAQKSNLDRHKKTHEDPHDFGVSCLPN